MREKVYAINEKLLGVYGIIGFLTLWEVAPRIGWADRQFIPPLSEILQYAWKLTVTGDIFIHMATSLQRTLIGLLAAILTAIPLGFILGGWFPKLATFLNPLLQIFGQVNAISLFPIFIFLFGVGELAKFFMIYWSTIWPVLFTTILGVKNVDPLLIKSARSMGAGSFKIFLAIILPGSAQSIFAGFRMGATTSFLMLVVAEMLSSTAGLGWLVNNSAVNNIIPRLYVGALLIAVLGAGINVLINYIESAVITWKEDVRAE